MFMNFIVKNLAKIKGSFKDFFKRFCFLSVIVFSFTIYEAISFSHKELKNNEFLKIDS